MNIHNQGQFFDNRSEIRTVLAKGKYTTLALSDGNDSYILTMNYGLDEDEDILYFHCSAHGTKLDFFKSNSYLCGTVIQDNSSQNDNSEYTYQSVVYYGLLEVLHKKEEKERALHSIFTQLADSTEDWSEYSEVLAHSSPDTLIMKLTIDEMRGKRTPG